MQLPNLVFSGSKKETRTNTILENFFLPFILVYRKGASLVEGDGTSATTAIAQKDEGYK